MDETDAIELIGFEALRWRLTYSAICSRALRISGIRPGGLKDYEISFIRLVEKISLGTKVEFDSRGTWVHFVPGTLYGGSITHDCSLSRGIGYFAEPLLILAPFLKVPLKAILRGVTNHSVDVSVDVLRTVMLPMMGRFGYEGAELHVTGRGFEPLGGGCVRLSLPNYNRLSGIKLTESGKVLKIRGIATSCKVSPQTTNRLASQSRGLLTTFIPDVYVYTDAAKGRQSGKSPGFSLSLVAESTSGSFWTYEMNGKQGEAAEDVGKRCAVALLHHIAQGGCVDPTCQVLTASWAVFATSALSKFRVAGPELTPELRRALRSIFEVMQVKLKITDLDEGNALEVTSVGIGSSDWNKERL